MPGVVLDAVAEADLLHHLDVVLRAHAQALGLELVVGPLEFRQALLQFLLDPADRAIHALGAGHVVAGWEHIELGVLCENLAGDRVQRHEPLDLITEELDPHRVFLIHGEHLDGVSTDAECAAGEGQVIAGVLDLHEPAQHRVAVNLVADTQPHHAVHVLLRRAQAVNGADGGHDDHIPPREQTVGRTVPQPLDLLVDRGVLLDEGVRLRDVCLGLVVVVVTDEVLDGVVGQQLPELVGQLGGQGLVRSHHQRRPLEFLDDPRGRGALAGSGRAEEDDVLRSGFDAPGDLFDSGRLVTGRLVLADHAEGRHGALQVGDGTGHASTLRRG